MSPPGTAPAARSSSGWPPWSPSLGHVRAVNVSAGAVEAYKAKRLAGGRAKATINRELACLRRAYRLASLSRPSLICANRVPTIRLYEEDNVRQGLVSHEDYLALVAQLSDPDIERPRSSGDTESWRPKTFWPR